MPDETDYKSLYYDHYKDTFQEIKAYSSKRDKYTLIVFILLGVVAFFAIDAPSCFAILSEAIESQFGTGKIGFDVINAALIIALLYSTLRYYQLCLTIERSYSYLHNVEFRLSEMMQMAIDRESKSYLKDYPLLSNVAHLFYTYGIPVIVIIVVSLKIVSEFSVIDSVLLFDVALLAIIVLSSIVYIVDRLLMNSGKSWESLMERIPKLKITQKSGHRVRTWLIIAIALVVCITILFGGFLLAKWYAEQYFTVDDGNNAPALLGDSFGTVNALVSAFAFAGMIVTLFLQRKDLQIQMESANAQSDTVQLQRFENTFFQMLTLLQSIVNDLYAKDVKFEQPYNTNGITPNQKFPVTYNYRGRNLFYYTFCICKHYVEKKEENGKTVEYEIDGMYGVLEKLGLGAYDKYYTRSYFDHYFRFLYNILRFVDETDWMGKTEKYRYTSIVRATLSRYELVWLFYNGLYHPKLKKLMEKYSILNNLRPHLLALCEENAKKLSGIDLKEYANQGFSGTDYEFYITLEDDNEKQYHITAFGRDVPELRTLIEKWNALMNGYKAE